MAHNHPIYQLCIKDAQHFGNTPMWLLFRCLPAIVLGGVFLLLLGTTAARAASTGADAPDLNSLESGHLLLRDAAGGNYIPAIIHNSKVHFDINGLIATVQVEQTFRNDTDRYLEGVYAFPLPEEAAVRHLEMLIGQRRIVGKIHEKAQAKKIFQAAKKAGKKASLVEQQRPNLFTNRVANIGPGEAVTVRMEYVQAVEFSADTFSLRFPMTITPRYMPGLPLQAAVEEEAGDLALDPYRGWARPTDQVPDAAAISPLLHPESGNDRSPVNPIEITAELDMGMPLAAVESPYHELALSRRAGVYSIRLVAGVSEMDRDFVLNWRPVTGAAPQAALFTERVGDEYFGLLMMVPPSAERASKIMPREMVFVVDTSGSMAGVSIEQARASVSQALQRLRPEDRFNIIEFNSTHRALYPVAMPATPHYIARAREFVRLLDASGGTEMLSALQAALAEPPGHDTQPEKAVLRQVIFITDGAVGNEQALFREITARLGSTRLFTVGIGSAPNSWFMRKAADFGRGTHTYIGDLNEVGASMAALFEQLSRPAVINLNVQWPAAVESWPQRVPDLYLGQPLSLAVNFGRNAPTGEVLISGQINGSGWTRRLQVADGTGADHTAVHKGVATLWARRKISGLLDLRYTGVEEAELRAQVLPLALQHQLLSPYTSYVAVEEIVTRPGDENVHSNPVPNTRPRGQADQGFAYPRTATTGPAKIWFGVLALFLSLLLRLLRQPEVDHVPAKTPE